MSCFFLECWLQMCLSACVYRVGSSIEMDKLVIVSVRSVVEFGTCSVAFVHGFDCFFWLALVSFKGWGLFYKL